MGRDKGIFIKTMFGIKGSRAKMSHKLKMQGVMCDAPAPAPDVGVERGCHTARL